MTKRKSYYEYGKDSNTKPFESESKFNHDDGVIPINNAEELEKLAMDYLSVKRNCAYYEAFEYTLKLIDMLRDQTRAINELHKNYTT